MMKISERNSFISVVLGIYVLLIGVGLPIIVRNGYFDILVVKYYYYCACTILMLILTAAYFIIKGKGNSNSYKSVSIKHFMKKMTPIDYSVIAFILVAIISTFSSDYLYESFWGNEGRLTGLFLTTWYVASYFCVSRFWNYNKRYIDLILGAGIFVCLFGITDYFKMDIFHFKVYMLEGQRPSFTSTLGNINTYTAYVGMIVAIAVVFFIISKQIRQTIWYYLCVIISIFAIIVGVSDNAYLSLAALFVFLPLGVFKIKNGIFRYFIVLTTFFSIIQCVDWINYYFKENVLGIDSAFNIIIKFEYLHYLVFGLWSVVVAWYFINRSGILNAKDFRNIFKRVWLGSIVLLFLSILYILYDCNVLNNSERYRGLSSYLFFNDDWGSHRGYIWRNAMECFIELPLWKKIVGYGPETFGILIMNKVVNNSYKEVFDSAHNEYLHILITVGIAGLVAYLSFIFSYIKRCISHKNKDPYIIAVLFAVICYSTQAFVNLNLPIVTPIFWLLLGIGAAMTSEE